MYSSRSALTSAICSARANLASCLELLQVLIDQLGADVNQVLLWKSHDQVHMDTFSLGLHTFFLPAPKNRPIVYNKFLIGLYEILTAKPVLAPAKLSLRLTSES
jgi:hypothetical protein